ncbi:MAG: hypothetical protein ABJA79_00225 [Parafilimonas sp.]
MLPLKKTSIELPPELIKQLNEQIDKAKKLIDNHFMLVPEKNTKGQQEKESKSVSFVSDIGKSCEKKKTEAQISLVDNHLHCFILPS